MADIKKVLGLPLVQRKALFKKARQEYYNDRSGSTTLTDAEFDLLEDSIVADDPNWPELKKTGSPVAKKQKVALPYKMPSLGKMKSDSVSRFLGAYGDEGIHVSDKIDGTSLELIYKNSVPVAAYTRGDGVVGGDVSFLLPYLKIPRRIGMPTAAIRCEGAFPMSKFEKLRSEFDSARGAASGLMNRTGGNVHPAIKQLRIYGLYLLAPQVPPADSSRYLLKWGFAVPKYLVVPATKLTANALVAYLRKRKAAAQYEMDGLVLTVNRKNPALTGDKPKFMVAFKDNVTLDEAPTTTVEAIDWRVSSHGLLIPRLRVKPVDFGGTTVRFASGKNAKYLFANKIGPGAEIKLVRSGDIIPEIVQVLKPGRRQLPDANVVGDYRWDKSKTNLELVNPKDSADANVQRLVRFFKQLDVDFIGQGVAQKLYDAGFTSPLAVLKATPKQMMDRMAGVKATSANKLYQSIQSLFKTGVLMPQLMQASGHFPRGLGAKKIAQVQKLYPDLLAFASMDERSAKAKLSKVEGWQTATIDAFLSGIAKFAKWFDKTGIKIAQPKAPQKRSSNKLDGVTVTWTGYRSSSEEQTVTENGGQVGTGISRATTVLLYSPTGKSSSKVDKAKALGVPVLTWDQFSAKYLK